MNEPILPITDVDKSLSLEDFDRDMDDLADGLEGLPILPQDFSRKDIYSDHD